MLLNNEKKTKLEFIFLDGSHYGLNGLGILRVFGH